METGVAADESRTAYVPMYGVHIQKEKNQL